MQDVYCARWLITKSVGLCGVRLTTENTKLGFGLHVYSILGDPVEIAPGITKPAVFIKQDLVCVNCGPAARASNKREGVHIFDHTGPTLDSLIVANMIPEFRNG